MSPTLLDSPKVRRFLKRNFLISVPTLEKRVALTYDDGPNPRNTPRLLDILEERDVRATFFLLGRYAPHYPEIVERMQAEGHEIGLHGHWHIPLPVLPGRLLRREIDEGAARLAALTGRPPVLYRPAMGWFDQRSLNLLFDRGYRPVIGDVYPRDSRKPGVDRIVNRVMSRVGPGSIIILHDGGWSSRVDRGQTLEATARIVDMLHDRGYRFQTVSELEGEEEG